MFNRFHRPVLLLAAAAGLAACSSYGDRGYGYSRVSVGVGSHTPYYGWYDGYYYPGAGYYVYDRRGDRHRWNDRHRSYWEGRRGGHREHANWSGYHRDRNGDGRRWDGDHRGWSGDRDHRRDDRSRERSRSRGDRDRARTHRNSDRSEWRHRNNGGD